MSAEAAPVDLSQVLSPGAEVVALGASVRATHATTRGPATRRHEQISAWYEQAFETANAGGTPVYGEWPPLTEAAHARKIALLETLPLPDPRGATILDYGVGDRGFAGVIPRLRDCRLAIGIDISAYAARESARISRDGKEAYGDRWVYLTAPGGEIDINDGTVDLVFAGEVIEHIDHTEAWLDEVHRVLKPGGLLLLTTPNAHAALCRGRGERWCMSPEHVALMGYAELCRYMSPRFDLLVEKGFNMSFHESLDGVVADRALADAWAACFEDRPDLATGVIVLARRRDDWVRPRRAVQHVPHDDPGWTYGGHWREVSLERNLTGRAGGKGTWASLSFHGTEAIIQFWAHRWSGVATITIDGVLDRVDLFSPHSGFRRLYVDGLVDGPHRLRIAATGEHPRETGEGDVIVHHVLTGRAQRG